MSLAITLLEKSIFYQNGGNCHKLFGEGKEIGEELTGYERRNVRNLLINTVGPNAEIREGYVNYLVTTHENQNLVGTITNRTAAVARIAPLATTDVTRPRFDAALTNFDFSPRVDRRTRSE